MLAWLTLIFSAARLLFSLITNRADSAAKHAQAITDKLSKRADDATKQTAEAEVRAASAESKADEKSFDLDASKRGGDW